MLLMLRQIVVRTMRHAFQFTEAWRREWKAVLDIRGAGALFRVVRQLVPVMHSQLQIFPGETQALPPLHALLPPECVPLMGRVGMAEELHFHLLELAAAEGEIPRRD